MLIKSKVLTEKSLTEKHFRQTDISLDLSLKIVRRSTDKCSFISIFAVILKLLLKITLTFSVKYFCRRNLRKAFLLAKAAAKTVKTTQQICRQMTSSRTPSDIYRKIPKMSPGAYIFQRPFLRGLFLEGLIFGGAYLRREICVSKSIGLALQLEGNLPFLLCFTLYLKAISKYKPPGGLYLEGRFNRGFFALRVWEAYIQRGLFSEFYDTYLSISVRPHSQR